MKPLLPSPEEAMLLGSMRARRLLLHSPGVLKALLVEPVGCLLTLCGACCTRSAQNLEQVHTDGDSQPGPADKLPGRRRAVAQRNGPEFRCRFPHVLKRADAPGARCALHWPH